MRGNKDNIQISALITVLVIEPCVQLSGLDFALRPPDALYTVAISDEAIHSSDFSQKVYAKIRTYT